MIPLIYQKDIRISLSLTLFLMVYDVHERIMKHGQVLFSEDNKLVICQPIGMCNLEGVMHYEAEFADLIQQLKSEKWALLNIYQDFETCGPDVIERLNGQLKWCLKNGCHYTAFVTFNSLQDYFVQEVCKGVPFEYNQIFSDADLAEKALRQQLGQLS